MSAAVDPPVPSATLLRVGPVFIGSLFSWLLLGVSIVQLYIYHVGFPGDSIGMQALVYAVFALDIFQTVAVTSMGWHILCAGWGRETNLIRPSWTWPSICAVNATTATFVQSFYAWRIYNLKSWKIVPVFIFLASLAQFIAALYISVVGTVDLPGMFTPAAFWLGGGVLTDIMISTSMVYVLYITRSRYISQKDSRIINHVMRLFVETGIVFSTAAVLELGLYFGSKETNLHLTFALISGKIYSNSLMNALNSRVRSRASIMATKNTVATLSSLRAGTNFGPGRFTDDLASHNDILTSEGNIEQEDDVYKAELDVNDVTVPPVLAKDDVNQSGRARARSEGSAS